MTASVYQWPEKTAGVICDERGPLLILKELLRAKAWKVTPNSCSVEELLHLRSENRVGCFIVVDSPNAPATETLRILFKNSRARLTPTLVLCSNSNSTDLVIFEKIFHVTPCVKPLTSSNFNLAFSKMISLWEQPVMGALRKVATVPDTENISQKLEILTRLLASTLAMPLALSAATQLMISGKQIKEAESLLLEQCRLHTRNPAMLALCAWFYLSTKMPTQAVRFLEKLKAIAPTSTLLNLDLVAGYLGVGDIGLAINALNEWGRRNQGNQNYEAFMAKLLIADGRMEQSDKFGVQKASMQKVTHDWQTSELMKTATVEPSNNEKTAS